MSLIDDYLPQWDVRERHRRVIHAEQGAVWDALVSLPVRDVPLTRVLMAVRTLGRSRMPVQARLLQSLPVRWLADVAGRDLLTGVLVNLRSSEMAFGNPSPPPADPVAFRSGAGQPRMLAIASDFRLFDHPDGTLLTFETRCRAVDASTRRLFLPYWWAIRPFSGALRREWLLAVERRARALPVSSRG